MTLVGETSCVRHSVDYGHTPGLQYPALDDYGRKKGQKPCIYWAFWPFLDYFGLVSGGPDEDRTHDLRIANAALSQLSYPPNDDMNFTRAISYRQ